MGQVVPADLGCPNGLRTRKTVLGRRSLRRTTARSSACGDGQQLPLSPAEVQRVPGDTGQLAGEERADEPSNSSIRGRRCRDVRPSRRGHHLIASQAATPRPDHCRSSTCVAVSAMAITLRHKRRRCNRISGHLARRPRTTLNIFVSQTTKRLHTKAPMSSSSLAEGWRAAIGRRQGCGCAARCARP